MKSYIDKLEYLGHPIPHVLVVNTIIGSLKNLFDNIVMNYNRQGWDSKSLEELHAMLKNVKKNVPSKSVIPRNEKKQETGKGCHNATYGKWEPSLS
ncbi:hypothetical protein Tco_0243309 [Tanacetum coccineum]